MKIIKDKKTIDEILDRGTIVDILPDKKEFRDVLLSGKRLKFYIGFDATAPDLHLGHAQNFILMEKFRKLGHEIIILFGDFTARIGDPSDKESTRKQLSEKEVNYNVKKWRKLVEPLMDFNNKKNPPIIKYNSRWLSKLNMEEILNLASNFTVQQMIERDMFQKRIKEKKPIYLHEFLYPLMQGYDSIAMNVDIEVCGTDQIFNALVGRTLLKKLKNKNKFVIAVNLLGNPKTKEIMSKSKGIGVFLGNAHKEIYGQIMAQPDEMIELLFVNCTLLDLKEIKKILNLKNPRDAKTLLSFEITKMLHGEKLASEAKKNFDLIFKEKKNPLKMSTAKIEKKELDILNLLTELKLVTSKAEAKRLIEQKGVRINKKVRSDWRENIEIKKGMVVQVGKRKFIKIS